jgi:predicted nuclease of predicted toxin-antitoxin system
VARLLLDENVSRSVGAQLALAGHDTLFMADIEPQAPDVRVLALCRELQRVLVTFDADFGELVFQRGQAAPAAIVLLRMHPINPDLAATLALQALHADVAGHFVVATPEGIRRRAMPSPGGPDLG